MRIVHYTAQSLWAFINSDTFKNIPKIPISYHRAISHIKNPRAKEKDVLLICMFDDDKMVGYLGILPDDFFFENEELHTGWMSCIWIDPQMRGKGIAKTLLQEAMEKWNHQIVATEFTETAKNVYMRSGLFSPWNALAGCRLYMRLPSAYILPPKNAFFQKAKPILAFTDAVFNKVADLRFQFIKTVTNEIQCEYISAIDEESSEFISSKNDNELCKRNKAELNWILKYPWILSEPEKDIYAGKYAFTSTEKIFENSILKVKNKAGKLIGIIWLTRRNHFLKMPYMYYENEYLPQLMNLMMSQIIKWKISVVTIYHQAAAEYLFSHSSPALYKKRITREYLASKTIAETLKKSHLKLKDGDGDCAFT